MYMGLKLLQSYYQDIVLRTRIIVALLSGMKYFAFVKNLSIASPDQNFFNAFLCDLWKNADDTIFHVSYLN